MPYTHLTDLVVESVVEGGEGVLQQLWQGSLNILGDPLGYLLSPQPPVKVT